MESHVKPFIVEIGDLRCRFTPDPEDGGYTVVAVNRRGVFSQGRTFEEAVEMIQDAERLVIECRAELRKKGGKTAKAAATRSSISAKSGKRRLVTAGT